MSSGRVLLETVGQEILSIVVLFNIDFRFVVDMIVFDSFTILRV
jgi:hypothetical protein